MASEWELIQQAIVDLRAQIDALCQMSWDRLSGPRSRDPTSRTRG